jgi:hypothetical protein
MNKLLNSFEQNIYKIVLSSVNQNGTSLMFANERFKNNFKIVLIAVNRDGTSLKFAS